MTGLTLNRVVVLARHGARSSTFTIEQFGTPGWVDEDLFNIPKKIQQINYNVTGVNNGRKPPKYDVLTLPCGGINGRLTTRGYNGNLAIGEHIRKTYGEYSPKDVYIRSTNMKRTIESARSIYAGVVDGTPSDINIEVNGDVDLECLSTHKSCSKALKHYAWAWYAGGLYKPMQPLLRETIRALNLVDLPGEIPGGLQGDRPSALGGHYNPLLIHDDITARLEHNLTINPGALTIDELKNLYQIIEHMALMVVLISNGISIDQKLHALPLKAGRLLDYIITDLKHHPLSILSVHDTTLIPMMEALLFQVPIGDKSKVIRFPPYSAHIDFEFYTDKDDNEFIRILYLKEPLLFDNKEFLPITDFKSRTDWMRLSEAEWVKRKHRPYSQPDHSDEDLASYIRNPRRYLKI